MSDLGPSIKFWKNVIGIVVLVVWLGSLVLTWFAFGILQRTGINLGGLEYLLGILAVTVPTALVNNALNAELERQFSPK